MDSYNNTTLLTIRETVGPRLKSVIGLHTINDGWLGECLQHLQQQQQQQQRSGRLGGGGSTSNSQDDGILYQILHSDLRDVIRGGSTKTSSSSSSSSSSSAGISPPVLPVEVRQLQDGIQKSSLHQQQQRSSSTSNNNNNKPDVVVLPPNFRLLCQIEEVVDMSQPSERRLLGSSAAAGANQGNNHQQQQRGGGGGRPYYNNNNNQPPPGRCLKICLVHGYKNITTTMSDPLSLDNVVIGMESARPISGLAPGLGTKAGTKVLLKGPIEIRDRILLLHNGNCIVLGGCIPWYVWRQRNELLNAKNKAGVGVDPTVRALIGTNPIDTTAAGGTDDGDVDENNDEGHESSSDYHHRPSQHAASAEPQAHHSIFATGQRNTTLSSSSSSSSMPPPQQNNRSAWAHSSSTQASRQPPPQPQPQPHPRPQPQPRHASVRANHTSSDSSQRQGVVVRNPYSDVSSRAPNSSTSAVAPSSSSRSPIPPPASNPYARHRSQPQPQLSQQAQSRTTQPTIRPDNISTAASNRDNHDRTKNNKEQRSRPIDIENRPPSKTSQRDIISSVTPASSHAAGAAVGTTSTIHQATPTITSSTTTTSATSSSSSSSSSSIQMMTFESLYTLLSQLLNDREMYESYRQQEELSFKVRLVTQESASRIIFNVDKVKKDKYSKDEGKKRKKKKDGKKYQYRVVTTFGDGDRSGSSSLSSKVIACKIDPIVVEPHFPVSPGELRSISRTDKAECDRLTNRGGASFRAALFSNARVWTAKLLPSADEMFGSGDNTIKSVDDRLRDVQIPVLLLQER